MKKIFNFTKKKKLPSGTPDNGSVLSAGYEIKEKDLGKVHKAASAGDVSKLKQLSKKNDLNQLDKENRTALHIACANGHIDVVQFLVESKAKLNLCDNQNKSPLMKAVECQHDRCVSVLLENHAEPGLVDIKGNTALHLAAIIPAVSAVMLLLEHGANINAQNKDGFTPLVVAVRDNHVEMAELLLKEGADVNVSDQGQRSPLMMAACNGHINMLRLLLQFDADVTLKDSKGWSSDDYAVINGHHACSHLIIEHGTKRNAMPSPSHQMSKKKKQSLIGSPAHGVEAGFALGGPATDKDDTEDNSQSESISRASKSAAEWPSSDDDDELDLSPKKQQKPNLKELIASKKGEHAASAVPETSLSGAESEPESEDRVQRTPSLSKALPPGQAPQLPVAPSPASSSKAPQMTSAPRRTSRKVDSGGEQEDKEPPEQPSCSQPRPDSEEEEDDEDEEEEEDDDEDEDEDEEEEDDDDDDEDDEEEDDDDDDEDEEEEEEEEEHECEKKEAVDGAVALVPDKDIGVEDIQKPSNTDSCEMVGGGNGQSEPAHVASEDAVAGPGLAGVAGSIDAPESVTSTGSQNNEDVNLAGLSIHGLPVTLDVEDGFVVSAIRVESRFSDDDDSVGRDYSSSSDHSRKSAHMAHRHGAGTPSLEKLEEEHLEKGDKADVDRPGTGSESDEPDPGSTMWNDSDDDDDDEDEDNQKDGPGRNTVLAKRSNVMPDSDGEGHSDNTFEAKDADGDGPNAEISKRGKRRSSWGSSLEGSDDEGRASPTKEDEPNKDAPDQEPDDRGLSLQPPTPRSRSTSPKPKPDESKSEWDSSSDENNQKDASRPAEEEALGVTGSAEEEKLSPASPKDEAEERRGSDDSWEDNEDDGEEMANDNISAGVSPEPEGQQNTDIQALDDDDDDVAQSPGKSHEHKDDDDNWDDDDDDDDDKPEKLSSPVQHEAEESSPPRCTPTIMSPNHKAEDGGVSGRRSLTPRNTPSPMSRPVSVIDEAEDGGVLERRSATPRKTPSPMSRPVSVIDEAEDGGVLERRSATPRKTPSPMSRPVSVIDGAEDGGVLERRSATPRKTPSPMSRPVSVIDGAEDGGVLERRSATPRKTPSPMSRPVSVIDGAEDGGVLERRSATPRKTPSPMSRPVSVIDEAEDDGVLERWSLTPRHTPSPMSRPVSVIDEEELPRGANEVRTSESQKDADEGDEDEDEDEEEEEEVPVSVIDGDDETAGDRSEDSDSQDQKLQYDFASATVNVPEGGNDPDDTPVQCQNEGRLKLDDEFEPKLTAYVSLGNEDGVVPTTPVLLDDLDREPVKEVTTPASSRKGDATAAQHHMSVSDTFSDEELPQTDIDDVDVDSPGEEEEDERRDEESPGFKNTDEPVKLREDSTEGEEDDEEEEEEERDDDEEEEEDEEDEEEEEDDDDGDLKDEREQVEEGGDSAVATTTVPESEASKDAQRDFLTELGLEKGEEDEDSWDSESRSESPKKIRDGDQRSSAKPHKEMSTVKEEKEDWFYIPSFLRGSGSDRMAILEPRRSVGRPRGGQGAAVRNDDSGDAGDGNGGNDVADDDDAPQEKTEKAKWEPLSVLRKLEGEADRKTDVMEEFGLGDVDDLEDASDWDSASTASRASRRTLPGRRVASPGVEELPEASTPSPTPAPVPQPPAQDAERDAIAAVPPADHGASPLPSPRSFTSHAPPRSLPLPLPQPRSRKWQPQKPGSEEESDWDSDNASSPASPVKTDDHLAHIPETLAALRPGSAVREPSPDARDHDSSPEPEEQPQKEKGDALGVSELGPSDPVVTVASTFGDGGNERSDGDRPEGDAGEEGFPWEKRYEKIWVEVEKREVKSTYKSVAAELKERFGELLQPGRSTPDEDPVEEEEERANVDESPSAEEDESSEEEEGEPIMRPAARTRRRSSVLLTIPELRESGLEDSLTESAENSHCEDRTPASGTPDSRTEPHEGGESDRAADRDRVPSDGVLDERRCPSPRLSAGSYAAEADDTGKAFTDVHAEPGSDGGNRGLVSVTDEVIEPEPTRQPRPEPTWEDSDAAPDDDDAEKKKSPAVSEEDPEDLPRSPPPSRGAHSAATAGVSDEELEEDMQRFKHEVGMLKVVFLDLEKEKARRRKEVREDEVKAEMEVRKPRVSGGSEGCEEEEDGEEAEEAESGLGHLGGVQRGNGADPRSKRAKSANRVPVQPHAPLQQKHSSITSGRQELVRGAQRSRAPQATGRVNGDPLSVFDDSTLSEVSDDGGRSPSAGRWTEENSGAMEMAEDFDELTQSSDTATDDIDSPTAGYRHASLLIQQLDCATLDSRSMVKLQNIFHEYERTIQKAKSRLGHQTGKVSQLEMERGELRSTLDEVKEVKAALERQQLELQTELNNLKFQLKQEQENHRNASMMYNTTREKLRRTEEQQRMEVEDKQRAELTLRNLELEMRTLVNNIKQLEEDSSESQRLLAQERSTRTLQENLLNNHLRKQQEIEEENRRNVSKSNEALSQLTEASDRERELLQQTSVLHEELTILKTELQRSRATSSLEESRLTEEAEALKERLEDARRDLKLNEDALTQTVFQYNNQLANLRAELSASTARLEHERQAREALETDVASTRNRLTGALQEAERCQATRTEAEKALLREKEERQRASDKHTGHAASQREAVSTLSQKLAGAEGRANSMENEVHRATLQLTEKSLLLDTLQREKDQAAARVKELEASLLAEREQASRAGARQEASQERLVQAQSDGMLLRQQLEEAQNKGVAKERAVTDAQERFSDILSKLRLDCEDRVQLVEERSRELAGKAADLREQVHKLEEEKGGRETGVRQLQQELADSLKKLSMSEASLEVNTRYRNDLEEEKARLHKDMDRLKGKLAESEDQYVDSERRINGLKSSLDEREREHSTTAQRLQEALSASGGSSTTIRQLEEAVQRLEIDNARLEAAAKQQFNKIDALQKGSQEAAMVRSRLEDMVSNLQGSKMNLEDQLNREVQKQSVLSHTAHDSQALWEEELKSRSRLGLRLAELEKEKGELSGQMDLERRKAKKIAEQKKAADIRLDQEMTRNTELQKEMYRLRTLLKTAKKRLREQDGGGGGGGGADFGSPMSSHRGDMGRYGQSEGAIGRMKDKVDELHVQLEREASRCSQLDQVNVGLKEQLASLKGLSRSNERLERSKQKLEEEVSGLRRQVEAGVVEQSQAEHYRRDAEERARLEIRQKLEEVNLFLQSQAASQDALDQMKSANEANLRSQLEQRIRDLEGELGRARSTQQDSLSQRDSTHTELERYRLLYTEELRLRKSLAAKLERSNSRLAEANGKLLSERHRSKSLIASSIVNGSLGPPSLDMGSLGSPGTYGGTLGPLNRSLGLGFPLLSPVMDGQNSRVEDYLAKMQRELEKNISKELDHATAELDGGSARVSPVGSASGSSHGAELDPLSRARQQYVEVLKKNYMI